MKQKLLTVGALALLFAGMCIVENSAIITRPTKTGNDNAASVYMLAGEFRTVLSSMLWMKAEQYHHEFLAHNPNWTQNKDLLGMLNLVMALDPTFAEPYTEAAYIQADGLKNPRKAVKTLLRGISHNPKAWELHSITAIMYAGRLKDPVKALPYARNAVHYAPNDFARANASKLLRTVQRMADEAVGKVGS